MSLQLNPTRYTFTVLPNGKVVQINQFDVVLVNLGNESVGYEKKGVRPAIVVSKNTMNNNSANCIVAPLTKLSNKADKKILKSQLILEEKKHSCLDYDSLIQFEDIRSVSKLRITEKLGEIHEDSVEDVREKLKYIFDLQGGLYYVQS